MNNKILNNKIFKSLLYTFGALLVYRLGINITMPFVNSLLFSPENLFSSDSIFRILTNYSGAVFQNASIFSLGLGPYISASIVVGGIINNVPELKSRLKTEGNSFLNKYTLWGTIPIAINSARIVINNILQGYQSNSNLLYPNTNLTLFYVVGIISLVAGTMFLVWLADIISDYGIGNGSSIIISAGILGSLPQNLQKIRQAGQLQVYIVTLILVLAGVVFFETALRKIRLNYPHKTRFSYLVGNEDNFLPLKINLAGVVPPIFTYQLLGISQIFLKALFRRYEWTQNTVFTQSLYGLSTFLTWVLITAISYIYMDTYFNAKDIAERLQRKPVAVIPNIRPGSKTESYITRVATRLIFAGAIYISIISIFTQKLYVLLGFKVLPVLSGTSVLIVATSSLEIVNKLTNQIIAEISRNRIIKPS